jgi:hypothetical protein
MEIVVLKNNLLFVSLQLETATLGSIAASMAEGITD